MNGIGICPTHARSRSYWLLAASLPKPQHLGSGIGSPCPSMDQLWFGSCSSIFLENNLFWVLELDIHISNCVSWNDFVWMNQIKKAICSLWLRPEWFALAAAALHYRHHLACLNRGLVVNSELTILCQLLSVVVCCLQCSFRYPVKLAQWMSWDCWVNGVICYHCYYYFTAAASVSKHWHSF